MVRGSIRIWPCTASEHSLAARLTAGPTAVYSSLEAAPITPTVTNPLAVPTPTPSFNSESDHRAVTATPLDNASFPWLSVREIETAAGPVRALRVNYVGELGWELHAANDQLVALYDAIWKSGEQYGIRDFGIYAVDSLRLDKGYRGWKQDLEIGFSPFDASLDRFVDLTKPAFVGKDALVAEKAAGSPWRFVSMTLNDDGDADAPFCASIFDSNGERIGLVTSGGWSFTLGKSVALGYIRPQFEAEGTEVQIKIFGEMKAATVGREPLFDPANERLRA